MANLELNLLVRTNADGTVSVMNGVAGSINRVGNNANAANQQLRDLHNQTQMVANGMRAMAGIAATALGGFSASKVIGEMGTFESMMINVKALTMANASEMAAMTKQARELGSTTSFSAQQAAEAQGVLASAGLKTNEILAATPGVLQLAAAGALELSKAADIATGVMSGMGLSINNLPHINDVLVKVAADTKTSVSDMGDALAVSAPIAKTFGISLEDLSSAMGTLAQNNIKGSEAGNNFKSMLSALGSETKDKTEVLAAHGLAYKDIDVQARGLIPVLQTLGAANLSGAEAIKLFGTDAAAAALALAGSASDVDNLSKALKESEGAAGAMAAILNQGLEKEIDALYGSVSEAILQLGDSGLKGALSGVITQATGVISVYSGVIDKFAESNKLTKEQKEHLIGLADGLKSIAAVAGGLTVVAGAIKAIEIATIAWNAALALNPIVAGTMAVGAIGGLIYKQTQEVKAATEQAEAARLAEYRKTERPRSIKGAEQAVYDILPNISNYNESYKQSLPILTNFNAENKQAATAIGLVNDQHERQFKTVTANNALVASSTQQRLALQHAENKALSDKFNIETRLQTLLDSEYKKRIVAESQRQGLDPRIGLTIAALETNSGAMKKNAKENNWVSPVGARGLMQIMPGTAEELMKATGLSKQQILNTIDGNIQAAITYLKQIYAKRKGDIEGILASYNVGPNRSESFYDKSYKKITETRDYVKHGKQIYDGMTIAASGMDDFSAAAKSASEAAELATKRQDDMYQQLVADANELDAMQAELAQSSTLTVFAEQLKLAGLTTEEIKKQVELQKALDAAVAAHPNQDPVVVKTITAQEIDTNTKLDNLTGVGVSKDANDAMETYKKHLQEIVGSTEKLGATNRAVFDGALGGINTMIGAFADLSDSLNNVAGQQALLAETYAAQKDKIANGGGNAADKARDLFAAQQQYASASIQLDDKATNAKLAGIRQMSAATEGMFKKDSTAQRAAHAITMALAGIEMAQTLMKITGIGMVTAAETASIAPSVAASTVKGTAKAAEAVATQATGGPFIGFALAAAMAAMMAAIGFNTGGKASAPSFDATTQGTVLGDKQKSSESVKNTYDLLKDIHASEFPVLVGIKDGITGLSVNLGKALDSVFQGGGLKPTAFDEKRYATTAGMVMQGILFGGVGMITGLVLSKIPVIGDVLGKISNWVFGSSKASLKEVGISTDKTALKDIGSGVNPRQYQIVEVKTTGMFGGIFGGNSTKTLDPTYSQLPGDTGKFINMVFKDAGKSLTQASKLFGGEFDQAINNYILPAMKVNLKDMNAEDASKALQAAVSTLLDNTANDIFGSIKQYQHVGEGMFDTVVRVSTELGMFETQLDKVGVSVNITKMEMVAFSQSVIDAVGGIQNLNSYFGIFFDKFYSDSEKTAYGLRSLGSALEQMNMIFPSTRQGWRDLVNSQLALGQSGAENSAKLLGLTEAADNYYTGVENAQRDMQQAADDASKAMKDAADNLKKIQESVTEQIADFGRSDVEKGIAKISSGIKALIDDAAKNLGTIPNIEELRGKQLEQLTKSYTDPIDNAVAELDKNPLQAIQEEYIKNIKIINDLTAQGLLSAGDSIAYFDKITLIAETKTKNLVNAIADPINKAFNEIGGNGINGIAIELQDNLKAVDKALTQGILDVDTAASLSAKLMATAANKVTEAFKSVNDAFNAIGKTDLQNTLANIKAEQKKNNDAARTWLYTIGGGRNASDANLALFDAQVERNNAVALNESKKAIKGIVDEFNNLGKSSSEIAIQGINDEFVQALQSLHEIATLQNITDAEALRRLEAIRDEKIVAANKELDDAREKQNIRLMELTGNKVGALNASREQEIRGLDKSLQANQRRINMLTDWSAVLEEFNGIGKSDVQKAVDAAQTFFTETVGKINDALQDGMATSTQGVEAFNIALAVFNNRIKSLLADIDKSNNATIGNAGKTQQQIDIANLLAKFGEQKNTINTVANAANQQQLGALNNTYVSANDALRAEVAAATSWIESVNPANNAQLNSLKNQVNNLSANSSTKSSVEQIAAWIHEQTINSPIAADWVNKNAEQLANLAGRLMTAIDTRNNVQDRFISAQNTAGTDMAGNSLKLNTDAMWAEILNWFKPVSEEFINIGKSEQQKAVAELVNWSKGWWLGVDTALAGVGNDPTSVAAANGARDQITKVTLARIDAIFEPLATDFKALNQSDYQTAVEGVAKYVSDWRNAINTAMEEHLALAVGDADKAKVMAIYNPKLTELSAVEADKMAQAMKPVTEFMQQFNDAANTRGMSDLAKAQYDLNQAFNKNIEAAKQVGVSEQQLALIRANFALDQQALIDKARDPLLTQLFNLSHTEVQSTARARNLELAAMDASLRPLQQMINSLTDLRTAAKEMLTSKEALLGRSFDAEKEKINKSYSDQVDALNKSTATLNTNVSDFKSLVDSIDSVIGSIKIEGESFAKQQYQLAKTTLNNALLQAKAGDLSGTKDAMGKLGDLGGNTAKFFSNAYDYAFETQKNLNALAELKALAGIKLTDSEKLVTNSEAQLEALKTANESQIKALDDLRNTTLGVDTSVVSVQQAINEYTIAKQAADSADLSVRNEQFNQLYAATTGISTAVMTVTEALDNYHAAAMTLAGNQSNQLVIQASVTKVPGFAAGGVHSGGLRLVGENGPELEHTGSSRIYNHSDTKGLLSNDELVAELRELRKEMKQVAQENKQLNFMIARHTKKLADIAEEQDLNGLPPERV